VTTWDTANTYSNGESERIIGKAIKQVRVAWRRAAAPPGSSPRAQFDIPRHRIVVLTKCFALTHDDLGVRTLTEPGLRDTRDYVNQSGLSRGAIFNQVDASLARLDTSYIDLYQIHRADLANTSAEVRVRVCAVDARGLMRTCAGDDEGAPRPRRERQGPVHRRVVDVDVAVRAL
jgi:aryl-alcohol dehydrogenase-like predicted oxidoreductase